METNYKRYETALAKVLSDTQSVCPHNDLRSLAVRLDTTIRQTIEDSLARDYTSNAGSRISYEAQALKKLVVEVLGKDAWRKITAAI